MMQAGPASVGSRRVLGGVLAAGLLCLASATPARADLVTLTTGRTLSVIDIRIEGPDAVLTLRGGGEVRCPAALVAAVAPDEVPQPAPPGGVAVPDGGGQVPLPDLTTRPYAPLIAHLATRHGLEPRLVHAVVEVESGYAPRARSRAGARGLMQLMPATARQYGLRNAYEPAGNLDAGIRHLKALLSRFDLPLALAAYNAGEAAVRRFGGVPPFAETQEYVRRVLRLVGWAGTAAAVTSSTVAR